MALESAKNTAAFPISAGDEDLPSGVIWWAMEKPSIVWSPDGKEIPGANPTTLRWGAKSIANNSTEESNAALDNV